jgi:4-alpha-glucanotransferase
VTGAATRTLVELARAYGVQPSYTAANGRRVTTPPESILGVLRALGAPVEGPDDVPGALRERRRDLRRRVAEPVVVAWDGRLRGVEIRTPRPARVAVELEDGGVIGIDPTREARRRDRDAEPRRASRGERWIASARERLPVGYHTLSIETGSLRWTATVFSAPTRAPAIPPGSWAVFAPLYSLGRAGDRSGIGSFTELGDLDRWAAGRGARMVSTLPLLAAFLDEPFEPSPYSPASRLFWNEVFVDVERARLEDPGAPGAGGVDAPAARTGNGGLVDYRAVAAAKRAALEPLAERFFGRERPESFERFVAETPQVRDYARFRAEVDRRRSWWGAWPATARDGRLQGAAESDPAGRYHLYVQWLARRQLSDVGEWARAEGRGLCLDLPLGANGASYDVWRYRTAFAVDASTGAPPDVFFADGQDWGFPPPHPERIRGDGYAYARAVAGNLLRYSSALRIDHVMGLHRLFWVPAGVDARAGAYVSYRADEWYALLSIEAHRAGAAIVGEDLGTVPAYVRRAMRRHRFHTSYVVQFEAEPALRDPPPDCVASLGTHDLPTWSAFWSGDDVRLFVELGLLDGVGADARALERRRIRDAIVSGLRERGLLGAEEPDAAELLEAALRFLGRSDAALTIVALEDLLLERRPQNVPGTGDGANWRGRLRVSLDELFVDEGVGRIVEALARERAAAARRSEAA